MPALRVAVKVAFLKTDAAHRRHASYLYFSRRFLALLIGSEELIFDICGFAFRDKKAFHKHTFRTVAG